MKMLAKTIVKTKKKLLFVLAEYQDGTRYYAVSKDIPIELKPERDGEVPADYNNLLKNNEIGRVNIFKITNPKITSQDFYEIILNHV